MLKQDNPFGWPPDEDWGADFEELPDLDDQGGVEDESSDRRRPIITRLADIEPEDVQWLWEPYIPLGKLTILEGDPGMGKTWLALQIATNVSRGYPFPGRDGRPTQACEPANVIYMTGEDGLADTLRPRLDAMGADTSRIFVLEGWTSRDPETGKVTEGAVTLSDLDVLEETLAQHRPALLVVDPLQAYLGPGVDMHRANETRPVLTGLSKLAELYRCAVVTIRHLGKSTKDRALYRGLGSIDFAAAARSILLVADDPDDETRRRRVMAQVKSSLAEAGPSLAFSIRDGFYWEGVVDKTAEALLAPRVSDDSERRALDEAKEFLESLLAEGPVAAKEVRRASEAAGIARTTLFRAKYALGIQVKKQGNSWVWAPPNKHMEHLEQMEQLKEASNNGAVSSSVPSVPSVPSTNIGANGHDSGLRFRPWSADLPPELKGA